MTMNTAIRHASVFLLVAFCGWLVFGPTAPGGGNAMATAGLADLPVASGIEDQSLPATSFVSGMSQGQQSSQGGAARSLTEEQRKKLQELQPQTLEEMEETLRAAKKAFGLTKIRQLCIATHKFHEVHAALPPGNFPRSKDEANRPLLSWRVYLLPYLGDEAKELFEKFKLDEPWDSEHNKQLIPEMPEFYALNGKLRTGMSDVQAPFGADTLLGDETNTTFAQVTDGVSLTAMFFEVGPSHAVPWTKPDDFAFDPDATDAMQRFGQEDSDEFIVGWADGGVSVLPKTTTTEFMQSIIMCTDGSPKTLAETGR